MVSSPSSDSHHQSIQAEEVLIKCGKSFAKLDPNHALKTFSLGERIEGGRCILKLANLIKPEEVESLVTSAIAVAEERKKIKCSSAPGDLILEQGYKGKVFVRLLTQATAEREDALEDALPESVSQLMEDILERAFTYLDQEVCRSLRTKLFGEDAPSIAQLFRDNQLTYSIREPAINVYEAPNGHFAMHKDNHCLSIVMPLSDPTTDFKGGGTAFWSQSYPMEGMDSPSLILKPKPGTAMLWGGRVSHKGMHISTGTRVVFVASFSGPDGPPGELRDRLSGGGLGLKTVLSGR